MKPQEGRNISEFEPGDVITRIVPAVLRTKDDSLFYMPKTDEEGNVKVEQIYDYSYRGDALKFLGIANNMIYLEYNDKRMNLSDKPVDLELERWADGWDIWVDIRELNKFSGSIGGEAK